MREELMRIYLVIMASAITGLALAALVDLKANNPAVGNPLIAIIFGSALIAGVVSTRTR
jgi:hypothetical protein